ncbi:MAG: hypothetical protein NZ869_08905, partial [Thermoanaerobaculum sp.]|nr:hypothetical protein [Thermoanaerobaculum sp.]MDW7968597.1 hypothetical protein [Thermoanaerobaculum sp.]
MEGFALPLAAPASLLLSLLLGWAQVVPWQEAVAGGLALAGSALLGGPLRGLRRWAGQLMLLPPAYALTLTADPPQRTLLFQTLLGAAVLVLWLLRQGSKTPLRGGERALSAAVPLLAAGPQLLAQFHWASLWALAIPLGVWRAPAGLGLVAILSGWACCSPLHPGVALGWLGWWLYLGRREVAPQVVEVLARWWVPLVSLGLLGAALLPYGGLLSFPQLPLSPLAVVGLLALAVGSAFLPRAPAAAAWTLGLALSLTPSPTPPDSPGPTLTSANPQARLPAGSGKGLYTLELALAHAGSIPQGTPVATLEVGAERVTLRAGRDACEWALLRPHPQVSPAHRVPPQAMFRPSGEAFWAVAGRVEVFVPPGVVPRVVRDPQLPEPVSVAVLQAGPQRPTPERSISAVRLLALTLGVVLLWLPWWWRCSWLWVPLGLWAFSWWTLALPMQPLRVLAERHSVDLALATFALSWCAAFGRRLHRHRWLLPLLGLLLPVALVSPQLSPLMGDEPYAVALAESLVRDGDLDVRNNVDRSRYPQWVVDLSQQAGGRFLHSPLLAVLLAPGYLVGGRTGMVVGIATLAWLAVVALWWRGRGLGFSPRRLLLALGVLLSSYPFWVFATELWVEMLAVAAVSWQLVWAARGKVGASALAAVATTVAKTRLGLVTTPLVGAALWRRLPSRRLWVGAALGVVAVGAVGLAAAALWFGNPLDPLGRRALSHLLPRDMAQPLRVVFGLAFDAAYGVTFSAPVWLIAFCGLGHLWRRGGAGERTLIGGFAATVLALLAYVEWRGGGSPPFRYLVPILPLLFLGLVAAWRRRWWRSATLLVLPPTLLVGWVAVTRPALLYNIGDGGQWLADALAVRFAADARQFFPSYLHLSPAAFLAPLIFFGLAWSLRLALRRWPRSLLCRHEGVALWLLAAAGLVAAVRAVPDRVVELEDPQVVRLGGLLEPHPGAWSRFLYPNGWRVASGEGVRV